MLEKQPNAARVAVEARVGSPVEEPETKVLTVPVRPGDRLGLVICEVTYTVKDVLQGGVIEAWTRDCPGSVQVGDRIVQVNDQTGNICELIRVWLRGIQGSCPHDLAHDLFLTVLRPVEFDILVAVSDGQELGLTIMEEVGFVTEIKSKGALGMHNAIQGPEGAQCLRAGDRIVQVSGREPPQEDGMLGNVMPYLRLALASGVSPLTLRVRRGEMVPPSKPVKKPPAVHTYQVPPEYRALPLEYRAHAKAAKKAWSGGSSRSWFDQKFSFSCLPSIFAPTSAVRSLKANLKLGRHKPLPCKVDAQDPSTPSTPSTKVSAKSPSSDSLPSPSSQLAVDTCDQDLLQGGCLTLPGVVRRVAGTA
jgi:hypothetical protein